MKKFIVLAIVICIAVAAPLDDTEEIIEQDVDKQANSVEEGEAPSDDGEGTIEQDGEKQSENEGDEEYTEWEKEKKKKTGGNEPVGEVEHLLDQFFHTLSIDDVKNSIHGYLENDREFQNALIHMKQEPFVTLLNNLYESAPFQKLEDYLKDAAGFDLFKYSEELFESIRDTELEGEEDEPQFGKGEYKLNVFLTDLGSRLSYDDISSEYYTTRNSSKAFREFTDKLTNAEMAQMINDIRKTKEYIMVMRELSEMDAEIPKRMQLLFEKLDWKFEPVDYDNDIIAPGDDDDDNTTEEDSTASDSDEEVTETPDEEDSTEEDQTPGEDERTSEEPTEETTTEYEIVEETTEGPTESESPEAGTTGGEPVSTVDVVSTTVEAEGASVTVSSDEEAGTEAVSSADAVATTEAVAETPAGEAETPAGEAITSEATPETK